MLTVDGGAELEGPRRHGLDVSRALCGTRGRAGRRLLAEADEGRPGPRRRRSWRWSITYHP